ncbi:hypothetical protein GBP346_A0952 [Burkholderia pseudomallei MSHR346]|nr:hypothetical protein GBP346_A0952 [Burkholderia pseudomallei MSHR346]
MGCVDRLNATVAREEMPPPAISTVPRNTVGVMAVCVKMAPVWRNSAD